MKKYRYVIHVVLSIVCLVINSSDIIQANESNWPQFHGPDGLGIASDNQTYPTELNVSRNLLWKIEVPTGNSSPCIWGRNIFITAYSNKKLETICIDRVKGEIKWRKSVGPEKIQNIHGSNSQASSTPACDGERVYAYFGSYGLVVYDLEGNEIWKKPLPVPEKTHGSAASPILAGDLLIINCDQNKDACLLAFDKNTGKQIWKSKRPKEATNSWSTPVLWKHEDIKELVVSGGHKLIAYDLRDGSERWWVQGLPLETASTPVYTDEKLFVSGTVAGNMLTGDPVNPVELPDFKDLIERYDMDGDNGLSKEEIPDLLVVNYIIGPSGAGVRDMFSSVDSDKDGVINETEWTRISKTVKENTQPRGDLDTLLAVSPGGSGDASRSHIEWKVYEGISQVSSPLIYKGRLYLIKHGGNITCYNANTGKKIYGDKTGARAYYFASPVAADNKLYLCSLIGDVIVIQAGNTFKVLSHNKLGEDIFATPALVEGNVYLRTEKNMYAFKQTEEDSGLKLTDAVSEEENKQTKTLYEAVSEGDLDLAKSLISSGADVNATNNWGWTPLYIASVNGNSDMVNLLISKGANLNAQNSEGMTPLSFAVIEGNSKIAGLLIESDADMNYKNSSGETLLQIACENGYFEIAAMLIDRGLSINAKNNNGMTPLHSALSSGSKGVVELLIDKGANVNIRNNDGFTPLILAASDGQKEMVELLINKGSDLKMQNTAGRTALGLAKDHGHTEVVELLEKHINQSGVTDEIMSFFDYAALGDMEHVKSLLSKGVDINTKSNNGSTALHFAADNGHSDIVKFLLENGADCRVADKNGFTPLHFTILGSGDLDTAVLLIENGADVDAKNRTSGTPLHYACQNGYEKIAELLISKGADINNRTRNRVTPLHVAASNGHINIVKLLISKGADIRATNFMNQTPRDVAFNQGYSEIVELLENNDGAKTGSPDLLQAITSGDIEQVRLLISQGADIKTKNNLGQTPLHLACRIGNKTIVELLVKNGANVNAKNNPGGTPLNLACQGNNKDIVELLIDNGANINNKNNNGTTPLHQACENGLKDIAAFLITKGADVNVKDKAGSSPLDLVKKKGNTEIVELLKKNGATE